MALQPNEQISLDPAQETGFLPFYHGLPEKPATTIRIFDRTDYYTVHGDDAVFTAKEVYKTTTVLKNIGPENKSVPSVILNKANFEWWLRELLLVKQYRVEVYRNKGTAKRHDWILEQKASPGNLAEFEDLLFAGSSQPSNLTGVMAIKLGTELGQTVVGVGFVDTLARKFLVSEYADSDHFSNLEAMTVQLGPRECLLPSGSSSPEYSKIKEILTKNAILVTERKKAEFSTTDIAQDLDRLLKLEAGVETSRHLQETSKSLAMSALSGLIKFLELLNDEGSLGKYKLQLYDANCYVRLDAAALSSLHLLPDGKDTNKLQSIYGVLNRCQTGQGQRLLALWIRQPLMDINKIEERQNIVGEFVNDAVLRQLLHEDCLKKVPDIQKLARKFTKKRANLHDCYRLYQALNALPQLLKALENHDGPHRHLIKANYGEPLNEIISDFSKFQQLVETTMDLELVENNEYVIKAKFDETLVELREKIDGLEQDMRGLLSKVETDLGLGSSKIVKLESNAQLGFYFRVTLKEEKILRGNKRYKIIEANKTGVRFRNVDMSHTNEEYLSAKALYETHQKAVADEVLGIAGGYIEPMLQLGNVLAELDVVVALAVAACTAPTPYIKPKILPKGTGIMNLVQARHPCLELQDSIVCIPNDASFNPEKRFQIITGPNMGGKSTYMRTVGIVVLMGHIGSFVPCDSADITVVDAVLTRIGCEDDHTRAISTFMLEMLEISSILRIATENSLLIIDELGRGTSTYDGFGLAWAISEKIAVHIRSYCMFATHFHELTSLEDEVPSVKNLHVNALMSADGPTFLYRVQPGVCDRSYGIHIAELVQFPKEVLEYAKQKSKELDDFQDETLDRHPELVGDDDTAVQNRKKAKKEGQEMIAEFLKKVKQLDIQNMTEEELASAVEALKTEVRVQNNAYVEDVLRRPLVQDESESLS